VSKEAAVETPQGTMYALFGLGYYYAKFQLADKRYTIYKKPLTGLLLADFVYDKLAKSKTIALGTESDIFVCEDVVKVPMDLSEKPENKLQFIKGMLTRFLFVPLKDAIQSLLEQIADPVAYDLGAWGHLLLSTHPDHYNQILVGYSGGPVGFTEYMKSTPSISKVTEGASRLLGEMFSVANLQEVAESIQVLKNVYGQIQYDLIDVYILLGNAADLLRTEASPPTPVMPQELDLPPMRGKHLVLTSALPRGGDVADWPEPLRGVPEEKVVAEEEVEAAAQEPAFKEVVHEFHRKQASYEEADESQLTATQIEGAEKENFELRQQQRQAGMQKQLPQAPEGDLEEIFLYLKYVIEEGYDLPSVGRAFEYARDSVKKMDLTSTFVRLLSRWANQFVLKSAGVGLSGKEKDAVTRDVDAWIADEQEKKRIEEERLEVERKAAEKAAQLEQERIDRERLAAEKAERIKQETLARKEQERKEQARLEKERLEREEAERLEHDRIHQEQRERAAAEQAERERIEQERLEKERIEREKAEAVSVEQQKVAQKQVELKRLTEERKKAEKAEKERQKKLKALAKQQEKLEKKKKQEEEKLKKLKPA
jgi:hypothetical protein